MKNRNYAVYDNKGFSLVELIVSILIMSVITGIVVILLSSSTRTYRIVSTDAIVQNEAELVRNFINEIAIEAVAIGSSEVGDDGDHCIWFLAPDNEADDNTKYSYYFIFHEADSNVLRYGKYECDTANASTGIKVKIKKDDNTAEITKVVGEDEYTLEKLLITGLPGYTTQIKDDDYKLLAENVTSIAFKPSSAKLITLELHLSFGDIPDYTKTFIFAGRNMGM